MTTVFQFPLMPTLGSITPSSKVHTETVRRVLVLSCADIVNNLCYLLSLREAEKPHNGRNDLFVGRAKRLNLKRVTKKVIQQKIN